MDDAEPARAGRMDRPRRILGIAVVAVVVLVVGSLVSNLVLSAIEKAGDEPYGERIIIDGCTVNVSVAVDGQRTPVLLSVRAQA